MLIQELKGNMALDFNKIGEKWSAITDFEFNQILESLPFQEGDLVGFSESVIDRLRLVRDNIEDCILELRRVLS